MNFTVIPWNIVYVLSYLLIILTKLPLTLLILPISIIKLIKIKFKMCLIFIVIGIIWGKSILLYRYQVCSRNERQSFSQNKILPLMNDNNVVEQTYIYYNIKFMIPFAVLYMKMWPVKTCGHDTCEHRTGYYSRWHEFNSCQIKIND